MREDERRFDVAGRGALEEIRAAQDRIVRLSVQVELRATGMLTLSVIFLGLLYAQDGGQPEWRRTSFVLGLAALVAAILALLPALRAWHEARARDALRPAALVGAAETAYLEHLGSRLEHRSLRFLYASAALLAAAFAVAVVAEILD